jgi:hypothetical protein
MTKKWILFGFAFLAFGQAAVAQDDARRLFSRETRFFQQERRDQQSMVRSAAAPAADRTKYDLTIGLAYTKADEDGHSVNTPFEFAATMPGIGKTVFKVFGDGFTRVSASDGNASGLADLNFSVAHSFFASEPKLRLGLGLKLGSGGDVGSNSQALFATAGYGMDLGGGWSGGASGKVRRDLGGIPDGVSRTVLSGALQVGYSLKDAGNFSTVFAQLGRARRVGASGVTFAVVGTDFSITPTWGGTFSVARGITRGARDTSVEIDFSRSF